MNFDETMLKRLTKLEREVERLRVKEKQVFVPLTSPLTSTAWDGDSFSTTANTKIDLSVVFGVPAGAKAVLVNIALRDSGSAANECFISLSPSSSVGGMTARCSGIANDKFANACLTVPCDTNGDIYYAISASGTGTMDVYLQIWGYWL